MKFVSIRLRWWHFALPLIGAAFGGAVALATPVRYTAKALVMPPEQTGRGALSGLGQLGDLAAATGMPLSATSAGMEEVLAILSSQSLARSLVEQFSLRQLYGVASEDAADQSFRLRFAYRMDKRMNTVSVSYVDEDPKRASNICNAALEALQRIGAKVKRSSRSAKREYLEGKALLAEAELRTSRDALVAFQKRTGLFELDGQVKATLDAIVRLETELVVAEADIAGVAASNAAEDNPILRQQRARIEAMRAHLEKVVSGAERLRPPTMPGLAAIADGASEFTDRFRAVKRLEMVAAALNAQALSARMDEERVGSLVAVIDPALVPDRKSGPRRSEYVAMGAIAGVAAAILLTLIASRMVASRVSP